MIRWIKIACFGVLCAIGDAAAYSQQGASSNLNTQTTSNNDQAMRRQSVMHFHQMAQQRPGLIIPLYQYPANVHTNETFNRVIALKREFPVVPFWVVLNPASGPNDNVDANYTKAIDRLQGAGCVTLGYVSTEYGKRQKELVDKDLELWRKLYPRIQGVFFDEMNYKDEEAAVKHQLELSALATNKGYWPIVTNPGADTPERFFTNKVADVIIVHESERWPEEATLHGNYFGGYSDYPPHSRAVLVHSMKDYDMFKVQMVCKYAKWIYVTQDEYRLNDPSAPNPWDQLSIHLERMCSQLSGTP